MPFLEPPWGGQVPGEEGTWHTTAVRTMTEGQPYGLSYEGDGPWEWGIEYLFLALVFGDAEPPPPPVGDPRDRLRSTVSEDLGSLLDAVEAIPVDLGFDVAFTNAVHQEPAVLMAYRELTRATDSPSVDVMVYPRPQQNSVMEEQFSGVTVLSRLANWYPPRIYGATSDFGLPTPATAPQVVSYVLSQWAQQQPWLTFKPVPDLRLPNGKAPSEYGPTEGVVTVHTITIEQEDRRQTALDILHDLLSPFPGTVVRQDSDGDLVILPAYGPDADETPVLSLRPIDAYSVSTGKPDPFSTVNLAAFTSVGGRTRQDNVPVMQPAWFQVGSNYRLGNAAGWFEPPDTDRRNLQPPADGDTTLQESLSSGQFGAQNPQLWPRSATGIPAGGGVSLRDQHNDPTITTHWRVFGPGGGLAFDGAGTVTILSPTVPFDGRWVDAFRLSFDLYSLTMRARWVEGGPDRTGIELSMGPAKFEANCWAGCWTAIVEVTLNDSSVAYAESGQARAQFGVVASGDSLPSASGGNAVAESQAAFGILERTINVTGYALDLATLAAAARGYVLYNITPRVTREVELAVSAQGATFDLVGRLVSLPNGEVGVLTGLTYADDFTTPPGSWAKSARVQLRDASAAGAIPPGAFEGSLTDTSGIALTDTSGSLIYLTGAN